MDQITAAIFIAILIVALAWVCVGWMCWDADLRATRRRLAETEQLLQFDRNRMDELQRTVRAYRERAVRAETTAATAPVPPQASEPSAAPVPPREIVPAPPPRAAVEYAVIQVRREDVLDALRTWAAKAVPFLELLPVPESAAGLMRTLVAELGTLVHRLDGAPAGLEVEPPVAEPSAVAHTDTENVMNHEAIANDVDETAVGLLVPAASAPADDPVDDPDDDDFDDDVVDDDDDDDDADDDFDDDDDADDDDDDDFDDDDFDDDDFDDDDDDLGDDDDADAVA